MWWPLLYFSKHCVHLNSLKLLKNREPAKSVKRGCAYVRRSWPREILVLVSPWYRPGSGTSLQRRRLDTQNSTKRPQFGRFCCLPSENRTVVDEQAVTHSHSCCAKGPKVQLLPSDLPTEKDNNRHTRHEVWLNTRSFCFTGLLTFFKPLAPLKINKCVF